MSDQRDEQRDDEQRDDRAEGEERHDPDERSGRAPVEGRGGRDDLSGRLMTDFERGPGEDDGEDELALRRLLHGAVSGIEPSTRSLDHLRRAVPARRARKRQALIGAAAAVVLVGTAVPALVHVAGSPGLTAANPALAGHGEQAQGGTGSDAGSGDPSSTKAPSVRVSPTTDPTRGAPDKNGDRPGDPKGDRPGGGTADDGSGTVRSCGRGMLRSAGAYNSGPDATGVVYGGFTIVNASDRTCVVDGDGLVGVSTGGAADPGRIAVVRHSSGDPASGLPDPSSESSSVRLKPGGSYQVKFAWVPSETCPVDGGGGGTPTPTEPTPVPTEPTPTPTEPTPVPTEPTPTPTEGGEGTLPGGADVGGGSGGGTGAGTESGVTTQLLRAEPAQGSVSVSHTAEPGDPTVTTVLTDACAGTVYRTGLLKG
ncbi:hypothetical protein GCM10010363_25380 [Streptomyces omiyaensis]|uniref:hypothetical protein n=1 Tax=Streptomyces omiyaensis TaxID=68247 RepID=UPI0019938B92|nr:hypothetical protein [Streptomyces omiyaensis]GGY43515.1 hypothetical protein GCM10010363_25380 [Streptomyces omiyaensis]